MIRPIRQTPMYCIKHNMEVSYNGHCNMYEIKTNIGTNDEINVCGNCRFSQ